MGEETGNLKGEKNEIHRKTDDSSSNGEVGGGGQAGFGKDDDKDTCLRKWFSLFIFKVEKDFFIRNLYQKSTTND